MNTDAAVEALARGMVVGVPTDTVYGLAVDPYDHGAVRRLFELKGRAAQAPFVVLVASVDQVATIVDLTPEHLATIEEHWPGALTAVLASSRPYAEGVGDHRMGTLAVRVPDHPGLCGLLEAHGPLAVSSANVSGDPPATSAEQAMAIFGNTVPVYMTGECRGQQASTVVDFTADPPIVLRQGPVVI